MAIPGGVGGVLAIAMVPGVPHSDLTVLIRAGRPDVARHLFVHPSRQGQPTVAALGAGAAAFFSMVLLSSSSAHARSGR